MNLSAFRFAVPVLAAALIGCTQSPTPKATDKGKAPDAKNADPQTDIRANLDKLSPGDRKLAEAQQYCAVLTKNALGSMGVPYKVSVQGEPVFLCCDGCEVQAKAHADRTLERVKKLKEAKTAAETK